MGKVNTQLPFLCGKCKKFFGSDNATRSHIRDTHKGLYTVIYRQVSSVDLRDEAEPSFADRAIAARLDIAMGIPTDDAWLLGE